MSSTSDAGGTIPAIKDPIAAGSVTDTQCFRYDFRTPQARCDRTVGRVNEAAGLEPARARLRAVTGAVVGRVRPYGDEPWGLQFTLRTPGGTHAVRVYSVAWRLQGPEEVLVGVDDETEALLRLIRRLEGRALLRTTLSWPSLDTTFHFDGCELRVFPVTSVVDPKVWPQWSLLSPEGDLLTVGPGSSVPQRRSPRAQ